MQSISFGLGIVTRMGENTALAVVEFFELKSSPVWTQIEAEKYSPTAQ